MRLQSGILRYEMRIFLPRWNMVSDLVDCRYGFCIHISHCRGDGCMAQCECPYGAVCNVTNGACRCPAGLHGANCENYCPAGTYGFDCKSRCTCSEFAKNCHPVTGACVCRPGFMGSSCNIGKNLKCGIFFFQVLWVCILVCPENTYGMNCSSRCHCGEGEICNPIVGCCVKGKNCPDGKLMPELKFHCSPSQHVFPFS